MKTNRYCLPPGTVLDERYVTGEVLGRGGFGITYEGENKRIGLKVAIKEFFCSDYMSRDALSSPQVELMDESFAPRLEKEKTRFLKEARILSDFSSQPGIVHVTDYFEANGTAYIVMSYLTGTTLLSYVKEHGPMDPALLFTKVRPLLTALEQVHRAGLLHRDISPGNIMLLDDGSLCLIDFGAAFRYDAEEVTIALVAKQDYTPPEQYSSNDLTPASDLYALCATLYYCVCGVPPQDALRRMLLDELASPRTLGVELPEKAEAVILKGLSLQPEDRWQSADALRDAITEIYPDAPETDGKKGRAKRIAAAVIIAAAAAAAAAGGIFLRTHLAEIRLRGVPTETLRFMPGDEMTASDYTQSREVVKGRVEAFAGKNRYIWKETDEGIEVTLAQDALEGKDPNYLCRCYLSRPLEFFFLQEDPGNLEEAKAQAVHLTRDGIEDAKVENSWPGEITEDVKAAGYTEGDSFLLLTLNEDSAAKIQQSFGNLLDQAGAQLVLNYDLDLDLENYYYNNCFSVGDGRTVCVLDHDQQGSYFRTREYFATHETPRTPLYLMNDPVVEWEETGASMTAGEYQVNENQIEGDYLLITLNFSASVEDGKSAWFHNVIALKERLDALKEPYAAGLLAYDDCAFVIKTGTDVLSQEEVQLLLSKTPYFDIGTKWYSSDIVSCLDGKTSDQEQAFTFSLSDYQKKEATEAVTQLIAEGVDDAYLFCGSTTKTALASVSVKDLEKMLSAEDAGAQLTFTDLTFTYDPVFVSFLESCSREELNDYSVYVRELLRFEDSGKHFPERLTTEDLPKQAASIYENQEQLIDEIQEYAKKAGCRTYIDTDPAKGLTAGLYFDDIKEDGIEAEAAKTTVSFLEQFGDPLQEGAFELLALYYNVAEEEDLPQEDRQFLAYIFHKPYDLKHMQLMNIYNTTDVDDEEALSALTSELSGISWAEDLIPEDMETGL